LIKKGKVAFSF